MGTPVPPLEPRELRLRRRIDSLLAQRAAKERRILTLEQQLRQHERRFIDMSKQAREARSVA